MLPSNILLHIASIQPPRPERGDDRIFWAESTNGEFTVKSAYYAISNIAIHARGSDLEQSLEVEGTTKHLDFSPASDAH